MIKVFNSGQTGTSQIGSDNGQTIFSVIKSCLVTGFNNNSILSISVSTGIATVTTSASHGYLVYDVIEISGANESDFNNEFEITSVPTLTTFTFDITTAETSATGTISCKISPLGWTNEFENADEYAIVVRATEGSRKYLKIDDRFNAKYADMYSYETMADIDTGTERLGIFYWPKYNDSDITSPWILIGNKKTFYFFVAYNSSCPNIYEMIGFGDFKSKKANDVNNCFIVGIPSLDEGVIYYQPGYCTDFCNFNYASSQTNGLYLKKDVSGIIPNVHFWTLSLSAANAGFNNYFTSVSLSDAGYHLFPVYIIEEVNSSSLRGILPGVYNALESVSGFASLSRQVVINSTKYIAVLVGSYDTEQGNFGQGNIFISLDESDW